MTQRHAGVASHHVGGHALHQVGDAAFTMQVISRNTTQALPATTQVAMHCITSQVMLSPRR